MQVDVKLLFECGVGVYGEPARSLSDEVKRLMGAEKRQRQLLLQAARAIPKGAGNGKLIKEIEEEAYK